MNISHYSPQVTTVPIMQSLGPNMLMGSSPATGYLVGGSRAETWLNRCHRFLNNQRKGPEVAENTKKTTTTTSLVCNYIRRSYIMSEHKNILIMLKIWEM